MTKRKLVGAVIVGAVIVGAVIVGAVIVGAPVLALGWWLGSPLLFDTEAPRLEAPRISRWRSLGWKQPDGSSPRLDAR